MMRQPVVDKAVLRRLPRPAAPARERKPVTDPAVAERVRGRALNIAPDVVVERIKQAWDEQSSRAPDWDAGDLATAKDEVGKRLRMREAGSAAPSIVRGAAFGLTDEIGGGLEALDDTIAKAVGIRGGSIDPGAAYERGLERERAMAADYAARHPNLDLAAEIAGSAIVGPARGVIEAPTIAGRLLASGGQGAAQGAAYGFGSAEGGVAERLAGAAEGGAIGAAGGVAIPIAVSGIGALGRSVQAALRPAASTAANRLWPEDRAARLVSRAFEEDGIPIADAARRLNVMRREAPGAAALVDVGGESSRRLLRAASNVGGPAAQDIGEAVWARKLGQPDRAIDVVKATLADPAAFSRSVDRLVAEREKLAGPLYRQAFATKKPVNVTGVVKYIDETLTPGATSLLDPGSQLRPDSIQAMLGRLRGFFAAGGREMRFDLGGLHNVKMEIDDMIGAAVRAGENNRARILLGVKRRLVQAMDSSSPTYKRAREIFAGRMEHEEALNAGRRLFDMDAASAKALLDGMTASEKGMFRIGAAREIADRVRGARDGRDMVRALFTSPEIRDVLKAIFPDEQAYRKFQAFVVREGRISRTNEAATGNSTTARQAGDMRRLEGDSAGRDVINLLLEGRLGGAIGAYARQALTNEPGLSERSAKAIADLLMSGDPKMIQRAVDILGKKEGALQRLRDRLIRITGAVSTVGGRGAAISGTREER